MAITKITCVKCSYARYESMHEMVLNRQYNSPSFFAARQRDPGAQGVGVCSWTNNACYLPPGSDTGRSGSNRCLYERQYVCSTCSPSHFLDWVYFDDVCAPGPMSTFGEENNFCPSRESNTGIRVNTFVTIPTTL